METPTGILASRGPGCILLDLDGTLADTLPALRSAYDAFLARFGIASITAEFDAFNGPPLPKIVETLQARHRLPGTANDLLRLYRTLIADAHVRSPANAGAMDFVGTAHERGWRIAVVTSSDSATAGAWLESAGLAASIHAVVAGEHVTRGKPAPEPYLLALQKLGGCKQSAFAVEDSYLGAQAALAAGLDTWILSRDGPKLGWPDAVFLDDRF